MKKLIFISTILLGNLFSSQIYNLDTFISYNTETIGSGYKEYYQFFLVKNSSSEMTLFKNQARLIDFDTQKLYQFKVSENQEGYQFTFEDEKDIIIKDEFKIFDTGLKKISENEYEILVYKKKNKKHPLVVRVMIEPADSNLFLAFPLDLNLTLRRLIFKKLNEALDYGNYVIKKGSVKYDKEFQFKYSLKTIQKINLNIEIPKK